MSYQHEYFRPIILCVNGVNCANVFIRAHAKIPQFSLVSSAFVWSFVLRQQTKNSQQNGGRHAATAFGHWWGEEKERGVCGRTKSNKNQIRKEVRRISLSSTGTVFGCRKIQNVLYRNSNRARWRKWKSLEVQFVKSKFVTLRYGSLAPSVNPFCPKFVLAWLASVDLLARLELNERENTL